jgi:4-alpha-glucanotransferase
MSKNDYQWWTKRFRKMADYFDAYRIDHILGFFRIWEIPMHSVQGLLGYFSPALPLTIEEISRFGMTFDEDRMTKPYIHQHFLKNLFGDYVEEVIDNHLVEIDENRYALREHCDTQKKIKQLFEGQHDERINQLRDGLYHLCNEVLFIKAENQSGYEKEHYHPRIMGQSSFSFADLSEADQRAFSELYIHFFYHRHTQFWRDEAMRKLPTLIASTDMLVCGEDLGMIPDCVPSVMDELQILRLEIQRMPKDINHQFENLNNIPYLSVCTTSTHDMSPMREWWHEDREATQHYYNDILWKHGKAPYDCPTDLCKQILINHLNSPAMLVIIPLQDWLSMSNELRRANPDEERINIPAVAQHYWRYRMHLNIEDLLAAKDFNAELKGMMNR